MRVSKRTQAARWGGALLVALAPLPWLGLGTAAASSAPETMGQVGVQQQGGPQASESQSSGSASPTDTETTGSASPSTVTSGTSQPETTASVLPTRLTQPAVLPQTGPDLPVGAAVVASLLLIGLGALLLVGPGRLARERYLRKH